MILPPRNNCIPSSVRRATRPQFHWGRSNGLAERSRQPSADCGQQARVRLARLSRIFFAVIKRLSWAKGKNPPGSLQITFSSFSLSGVSIFRWSAEWWLVTVLSPWKCDLSHTPGSAPVGMSPPIRAGEGNRTEAASPEAAPGNPYCGSNQGGPQHPASA